MLGRLNLLVVTWTCIAWGGLSAPAWGQAEGASGPAPHVLDGITVSATPLSRAAGELAAPATVLDEPDLLTGRAATLGETLEREPGITATHFGAGASRPIIRGMDGARVKVLSDGAEVQDASTISPDHAVGLEPMLSHRVEVLRGPAALLYGGGALGGVVNVLDHRVPTEVPEDGLEGSVEVRGATGARETAGAFELTTGGRGWVFHAEGLKRNANDYAAGRGWSGGNRVGGSYNHTETGSLGLSWVGDRGYLGLAYTLQRNRYGLPGHEHAYEGCHAHGTHLHCPGDGHGHDHGGEDGPGGEHEGQAHGAPFVSLRSQRWDVRGEWRDPFAGFSRVRVRGGFTDYQHDEIEEERIATTFRNKAHDGRIELEHAPWGGLRGVVGVQASRRDFSALGEEAFVQPTLTRNHGVFALEEYAVGDWRFEAGVRHEWQRIDVRGDSPDARHRGTSVSAGAVWRFAPSYSLGMSISRSQRLPTAEELYANGLHLATSTYEVGNPSLKRETSRHIDVTLRKLAGPTTFSVSVFRSHVDDFIYGRTLDVHDGLQLLAYTQGDASFTGVEAKVRHQIDKVFAVSLLGDYVRARLDGGGNLPRIPPYRVGARLDAKWQAWRGNVELSFVGRQGRVAAFETPTPGYAMLNLGAGYEGRAGATRYQVYVRAMNLTDKLAYRHTSFIKYSAPLMGRSLVAGVRWMF